MATYEMFWDCRSCGTTKLLGKTHRHCPACGGAQDPSWRYFPPEDEKVAVQDHVFVGVDWVCERCDTPNSAAATHCVGCGDARDGSEADAVRQESVVAGEQSGKREPRSKKAEKAASPPPPPRRSRGRWVLGCLMLVGMAFAFLVCLAVCWTRGTEASVTGHSWKRTVTIERLASRSSGDWCSSMPSDAYGVSRSVRQSGTRQIPDGESCTTVNSDNGDGTFSQTQSCSTTYRSEPEYDDWCDYTVDRWGHDRSVVAEGRGTTPEPRWPAFSVDGCSSLGCTREGGRKGSYFVHFLDADGDDQVCDLAQPKWASMAVGSRWKTQKYVLLDNLVCYALEPIGGAR
ncbi:MAG: hypothetical protein KC656_18805 [Myxococcales bacterium]|nr:hypothetical protein [Myxococcales bacterium]MCB9693430.1 zinc ribbon domain-containing protein [Alphaproteobacteria bacterium]